MTTAIAPQTIDHHIIDLIILFWFPSLHYHDILWTCLHKLLSVSLSTPLVLLAYVIHSLTTRQSALTSSKPLLAKLDKNILLHNCNYILSRTWTSYQICVLSVCSTWVFAWDNHELSYLSASWGSTFLQDLIQVWGIASNQIEKLCLITKRSIMQPNLVFGHKVWTTPWAPITIGNMISLDLITLMRFQH